MTRDIAPDPRQALESQPLTRTSDPRELPAPEQPLPGREHALVRVRGERYRLSPAELDTMRDIGRFRTVEIGDLTRVRYRGDVSLLKKDVRSLAAQGLVQRRSAWVGGRQGKLEVLVLTRWGKQVLECERPAGSTQAFHAGFVKPSEVAHDAAIYRMYQAEASRIEKRGAIIGRVVLDYELKRKIYTPLAKARHLSAAEYARRQAAVAQEHGLRVVRGTIPLPDLRIEYQTRDVEMARVDLELATHHYHGSHLQTKADAGFTMYVADGSAGQLTRVMEEREITAAILSL